MQNDCILQVSTIVNGTDEKASACVSCGACLKKCPQHIQIPEMLKKSLRKWKAL